MTLFKKAIIFILSNLEKVLINTLLLQKSINHLLSNFHSNYHSFSNGRLSAIKAFHKYNLKFLDMNT